MTDHEISKIAGLIHRVKEGDSDAFVQLYNCMYPKVFFFSFSMLQERFLAEDAVQEVFIAIYKKIHDLKDERLFVAWMNRITYYTCLRIQGKNREIPVEKNFFESAEFDVAEVDVVLQETMDNERSRVLYNRIMKLPKSMRTVLVMKYYNESSLTEIAEALNCPLGTVKSRLNKAKQILKKGLVVEKDLFSAIVTLLLVVPISLSKYQKIYAMQARPASEVWGSIERNLDLCSIGGMKEMGGVVGGGIGLMKKKGSGVAATGTAVATLGVATGTVIMVMNPQIQVRYETEVYVNDQVEMVVEVEGPPIETVVLNHKSDKMTLKRDDKTGEYIAMVFENGTYEIVATTAAGVQGKKYINMDRIDKKAPVLTTYAWEEVSQILVADVEDQGAGIDWETSYVTDGNDQLVPVVLVDSRKMKLTSNIFPLEVHLYDHVGNYSIYEVYRK